MAIAQETWGTIIFKNFGIPTAAGGTTGGGNGSGTYNVPIWTDSWELPATTGAGMLSGGVTAGLFQVGATTPLATSRLGTTSALSPYFANPISQTVTVPGVLPGQTTTLIIRIWQGPDFQPAKSTGYNWEEWALTTKPLGGVPTAGGATIPTPSLTGWGSEDGSGFFLGAYILNGINSPRDTTVFASPANINVTASWYVEAVAVTNVSIFADSRLVSSQATAYADVGNVTGNIAGLRAGEYSLVSVLYQRSGINSTSAPVTITVVDPVAVSVGSPRVQDGQLAFEYTVNPGLKYVIESSSDLQVWQPVLTNVPTANPAQFSDGYSPDERRFYRVGRLPNP